MELIIRDHKRGVSKSDEFTFEHEGFKGILSRGYEEVFCHLHLPKDHYIFSHRCKHCNDRSIFAMLSGSCHCTSGDLHWWLDRQGPWYITLLDPFGHRAPQGHGTVGWFSNWRDLSNLNHLRENYDNLVKMIEWLNDPETEKKFRELSAQDRENEKEEDKRRKEEERNEKKKRTGAPRKGRHSYQKTGSSKGETGSSKGEK